MSRFAAVFCLCTAALFAQPPAQLNDLTAFLELSPEQASRLQQVYQARQQTLRQLWDEINANERRLQNLLNSRTPDALAAGNLLIAIQGARRQIKDQLTHDLACSILTAAQRRKLATLETAMRLRPALDQAIMAGLIEQSSYPAAIPPVPVSLSER